jgi:pantetheine-phosphate adenylyltransferase/16S rRNA (guanine(966)-N(2))-methyltransferase RsmD
VRPTSDKVREALMSSLSSLVSLEGVHVVDLYAGSGALGLEALSRGAARCTFVERDRKTAKVIEKNIETLGLTGRGHVVVEDAARFAAHARDGAFGLVLVDPPYATALGSGLLEHLVRIAAPDGLVVLERDKRSRDADEAPPNCEAVRDRLYGDTRVIVYQRSPRSPMASAAIYPGSFDPLTNGHVDIIQRGLKRFDRVVVAIANNVNKSPLFTIDERIKQAKTVLGEMKGVEVDTFDGLIVDYAKKKGVGVLLRGLRAVSDFEYEFQLASMNRKLNPDVDTMFMMTSEDSFYLSSRLVREVASFGGNVEGMVPDHVLAQLKAKYGAGKKGSK